MLAYFEEINAIIYKCDDRDIGKNYIYIYIFMCVSLYKFLHHGKERHKVTPHLKIEVK
jgi:hypothetical protein